MVWGYVVSGDRKVIFKANWDTKACKQRLLNRQRESSAWRWTHGAECMTHQGSCRTQEALIRMHDASGKLQDAGGMGLDAWRIREVAGLKHVQLSSLHLMPHSGYFAQKLQVISLHIDKIGCFKGKNRWFSLTSDWRLFGFLSLFLRILGLWRCWGCWSCWFIWALTVEKSDEFGLIENIYQLLKNDEFETWGGSRFMF